MHSEKFNELRKKIAQISDSPRDDCIGHIEERLKKELEFHDRYRNRNQEQAIDQKSYEKIYGNRKYYSATQSSNEYIAKWIENETRGMVFLDYCCGDGKNTILAAKTGAVLSLGIDLSFVSLQNASEDARREGVGENSVFLQANAEDTQLPDQSIERILCSGVLHHLDLEKAFKELARILAPGGKILCVEALNYNPAIKLYRHFTPAMRTEWEKENILSLKDVKRAQHHFDIGIVRFWHITGILSPHFPFLKHIFKNLDAILCRIPFVQLMAWIFTFELIKPLNGKGKNRSC